MTDIGYSSDSSQTKPYNIMAVQATNAESRAATADNLADQMFRDYGVKYVTDAVNK